MVIKVNVQSLFLPDKYFRGKIPQCRSQPKGRYGWRFIHTGQSLVFRDDDKVDDLASFVAMEPYAFIDSLRDELAKYKSVVGIECNDGLFVHPEALGKILIKLREGMKL